MTSIIDKISSFFKRSKHSQSGKEFQEKYQNFQNLLVANDHALEKMAVLSEMLSHKEPFAFGKGRRIILDVLENTSRVILYLQSMCRGRFEILTEKLNQIHTKENSLLTLTGKSGEDSLSLSDTPYYLELQHVNVQHISKVGGKMARLGEVKNVLGIPVPDGICITSRCFEEFLTANNLRGKIDDFASNLDINNSVELQEASRAIQAMLVSAPIPQPIEDEILKAYDKLCQKIGDGCLVAVRSSAVGEDDPRHSFAGLHYTALNVSRQNLVDACWEVLISKYLPESMVYRFITGLRDIDMPMNIGCMIMLDPVVSGTLYTVDPQKKKPGLIIQAIQGVGSLLVEGKVAPQEFIVDRSTQAKVLEFSPGNQNYFLKPRKGDGLDHVAFDPERMNEKLLTQKQIEYLAGYSLTIEAHFGTPQDIEWAISQDGSMYILQTRPLQVVDFDKAQTVKKYSLDEIKSKHPSLLEGGECSCLGVGSGPVFIATQERFLVDFPDGGVLVAKRTSPAYARVLHKAAAVITEVGSTTGHLSIIARELGVPTILNLKNATNLVKNKDIVTVDAFHGVVFIGNVEEVINGVFKDTDVIKPFHNTPIYKKINLASEYILPLNLTDPQLESFAPQNCQTAHDITRFCHEMAILDMFNINDSNYDNLGNVRKLDISIPLEIFVADLGGGFLNSVGDIVKPEDIQSKPFKALIEGMETPGLPWSGPVPMDIKGFAGLIVNTMVDTGRSSREMGKSSYAFISPHYLNFSARLGYHFSNLDAYTSRSIHRNYISYRFKGGAADATRRSRRAKFITEVLRHYGFTVMQKGDHVHSTIRKIEEKDILELIKNLGRLMGAIRNADVTMNSNEHINMYAEAFLAGSSSPVKTINQKLEMNNTKGD